MVLVGAVMGQQEAFGERLREAIRARLGPNMEREFARRIGMDPTQLSRTLNGKVGKRPEFETLQRFADGLGLPLRTLVDWLLPPEALAEPPTANDPLWVMVERVRANVDLMRQLRALEEASAPEVFQATIEAVAEAWRANLRMGMDVAEAQRAAARTGTDGP